MEAPAIYHTPPQSDWTVDLVAVLIAMLGLLVHTPAVSVGLPAGAELPSPTGHIQCDSAPTLTVEGSVALHPQCIYRMAVRITRSNSELDCQGSILEPAPSAGHAIHIDSEGKPLGNVTVRNCIIRHANASSIRVGWSRPDRDKADGLSRKELYRRSPRDVRIVNTQIEDSRTAGIYVDDYVSSVLVDHVTVLRSQGMAIYLDHSSRGATIRNSLFEANGAKDRREALSIDSSAQNIIVDNIFRDNLDGGIFLYKNCHERSQTDPQQVHRWQGSDRNLIERNLIENSRVGVWIASRQSRDLRRMDCGDPYYGDQFVIDRAQDNTIRANRFRGVDHGVVVEDDRNRVIANVFEEAGTTCVLVGSAPRFRLLGKAVIGVKANANRCEFSLQSVGRSAVEFRHGSGEETGSR